MDINESYIEDFKELLLQENEKPIVELLESAPHDKLAVLYETLADHISKTILQTFDIDKLVLETVKIRSILNFTIGQVIELFQNQGEIMTKQNEAIAKACKKVFALQYKAYSIILDFARQHKEQKGLLAITIHRMMMTQLFLFLISHLKYNAIADKEWLNLHRLFIIAQNNQLKDFTATDEHFHVLKSSSISQLYIYSLLMGCSKLHTLTIDSMLKAFYFILEKGSLVSLNNQSTETENEIVVDISSGLAPNYRSFFTPANPSVFLYLHFEKMLDALKKHSTENTVFNPSGLTNEIKTHLISTWGTFNAREYRYLIIVDTEATIGLLNIHYYLCGGKELMDFQTTIANLTLSYNEDELIPVIEQQKSTDTWAPAINSPIERPFQDEHLDSLTFQRYFDTEKIVNTASHPKFKCKIIDQSPHGCCLELPNAALFSLTVNELISFRSEIYSTHWQVGIISWFKVMENETVQVGIHLLSTKAIPLGIEIPFSYGSNKNCIEAILIPYENSLKTHSSILVKEKYINENEVVKVLQKGLVKDLKISDQIHKSEHYNHFNCGIYIDEKK